MSDAKGQAKQRYEERMAAQRAQESAFLVLLDDGRVFSGHLDRERAEQKAKNVEGIVVALPIVADFRRSDGG